VAYVACLALAVVYCACACGSGPADHAEGAAQHGAVITVGSFDFPESVQFADIYAGALTDPAITADHLVVLADDRGLQPAENVVPLVRQDVVARYGPRLLAVLDAVSARLTTGSLRALDARAELCGQDPRLVAESWLRTQGLASAGGASH